MEASSSFNSSTTIGTIPAYTTSGWSWNQWAKKTSEGGAKNDEGPQCERNPDGSAKANGCENVYTQYMLVYDEDLCWPKSSGLPILANKYTTAAQMRQCRDVVMHLLNAKPKGAYVTNPYEQRDAFLLVKPIVTCGNNVKGGNPTAANPGYPQMKYDEEGGGGMNFMPWTYAENTGMCQYKSTDPANAGLSGAYSASGERYGGTVQVEEFGHTIFDVALSYFDPEGWRAVQWAAKLGRFKSTRSPDADWDCFTSATEYFAAGVELLLYDTRIGTNLKVMNRTHLKQVDPNLYCLAARYHENNNLWRPCANGPANTPVKYDAAFCKTTLQALGLTKFGDGNGEKATSIISAVTGSGTVAELKARGVKTGKCAPPPTPPTPTPTPTPTPAAKKDLEISQTVTFENLGKASDYTAAIQAVYNLGYGSSLGLTTTTNGKIAFETGASVTSSAARRDAKVTFKATIKSTFTGPKPTKDKLASGTDGAKALAKAIKTVVDTNKPTGVTAPTEAELVVAKATDNNSPAKAPTPVASAPCSAAIQGITVVSVIAALLANN